MAALCFFFTGLFLATSAAKAELLCDSCMVILNSDFDAESVKSRCYILPSNHCFVCDLLIAIF